MCIRDRSTVCPSVARFNSTPFSFARGSSEATAEATAEAAGARERMGTCLRREGRLDTGFRPATGRPATRRRLIICAAISEPRNVSLWPHVLARWPRRPREEEARGNKPPFLSGRNFQLLKRKLSRWKNMQTVRISGVDPIFCETESRIYAEIQSRVTCGIPPPAGFRYF